MIITNTGPSYLRARSVSRHLKRKNIQISNRNCLGRAEALMGFHVGIWNKYWLHLGVQFDREQIRSTWLLVWFCHCRTVTDLCRLCCLEFGEFSGTHLVSVSEVLPHPRSVQYTGTPRERLGTQKVMQAYQVSVRLLLRNCLKSIEKLLCYGHFQTSCVRYGKRDRPTLHVINLHYT